MRRIETTIQPTTIRAPLLLLCWLGFLFSVQHAQAQLAASFTTDKPGACAPALIQFSNTSTGASPAATYLWDFGNGNTSALPNPAATFTEEKDYTVTLTVTDGNNKSTATRTVSVYKKPAIDFRAGKRVHCIPEAVVFTSSGTPGSGSFSSYTWDFGDGNIQTQFGNNQVQYNYREPLLASVSLTVANSFGCYSTVVKKDLVQILQEVKPAFSSDKQFVCRSNDQVQFSNQSTGPGMLSYVWDFGDGTTSTQQSPSHTYNKAGTFNVTLTVNSSSGCSAVSSPQVIHVENFITNFSTQPLLCQQNFYTLSNISTPTPTSTEWTIGTNPSSTLPNGIPISHFFPDSGNVRVTMVNQFGTCVQRLERTIRVEPIPQLTGFIAEPVGKCGAPDVIRLRDTTATAVAWRWLVNYSTTTVASTARQFDHQASFNGFHYFDLQVTNAQGCSTRAFQSVLIQPPSASIFLKSSTSAAGSTSCGPFSATFGATGNDEIVAYNWQFSNGGSSTEKEPTNTFSTAGTHTITLQYTLANGCRGTTAFSVSVFAQPTASFTTPSNNICGPATAFINNTTPFFTNVFYFFDVDNDPFSARLINSWNYNRADTYTVRMVVLNGPCTDTLTKKGFFRVSPPFPRITQVTNTCEGTRGAVTFTHETAGALTGIWNFGDGNTAPFNPAQPTITHTYSKTGLYNVSLVAVNGSCAVSAGTNVPVLLKQQPLLTVSRPEVCSNEQFNYTISNVDTNPSFTVFTDRYFFKRWEYGDGSEFEGSYSRPWTPYWISGTTGTAVSSSNLSNNIRVIFTSRFFNCDDTTNFVPLTFKGARAGFEILTQSRCWQDSVRFRDTSVAFGSSAIVQRTWNFGDGNTLTTTRGGVIAHRYQNPGNYTVTLSITDAGGCTVTTSSQQQVTVSGPKAAFAMSGTNVPLNQTVFFFNGTLTGNSFNTQYHWQLGDGSTSTDFSPVRTYPVAGTYQIVLAAFNPETGCRDTARQTLTVRPFNTAFQMNSRFLQSGNCPPVAVQFVNTSFGAVNVEWDFGDGTGSTVYNPTKIYSSTGKFQITLKVFGFNGLVGTYRDSIIIGEPNAPFAANPLFGCTSQDIRFAAQTNGVRNFIWDFGDGTTRSLLDSNTRHQFMSPGIYQPRLLIADSNGCTKWADLPDKVVIDSVAVSLPAFPKSICDSATLAFSPAVTAVGSAANPGSYVYQWRIVYNGQTTTLAQKDISYNFNRPGTYLLSFNVKSPFGCDKTVVDSVVVVQGLQASITGKANLCPAETAAFTANAQPASAGISWLWQLPDNTTRTTQQLQGLSFAQPGTYQLQLIARVATCADTSRLQLIVHPNPTISIGNRQPIACLGRPLQLSASGANQYQWSPAASLNNANIANPLALPASNTRYVVTGTSAFGCTSTDSVLVTVANPIQVAVSSSASSICAGESANLQASGAATYRWIGNTGGLSSTSSAATTARPASSTSYTVVGADAVGCFTDTATINLVVNARPTVNAGPDIETTATETVNLRATGSVDVVSYLWQPANFLSCTNCPNPQSKPLTPITYTVTVRNDKNCAATDTLNIRLLCGEAFYIPNSFTPNNDGKNDRFYVLGGGATVKSFRIFNRWGALVFEANNVFTNDRNGGWDGRFNGQPAPMGTYVYMAQIECFNGTRFEYKGTVTLIR